MTSERQGRRVIETVANGWGTPVVRSEEVGAFHLYLKPSSRLIWLPKAAHKTNLNLRQKLGSRMGALSGRLWVFQWKRSP